MLLFRGLSVVSRGVELAPFAVTSDGKLSVNAAKLSASTVFASVVRAAGGEKRAVFIGVLLSSEEAEFVMARLDNAADETAARLVGQRRRRATTRNRRTTRS